MTKHEEFSDEIQAVHSKMVDYVEDLCSPYFPQGPGGPTVKVEIFTREEYVNCIGFDTDGVFVANIDSSYKEYVKDKNPFELLTLIKKLEDELIKEVEQDTPSVSESAENQGDSSEENPVGEAGS